MNPPDRPAQPASPGIVARTTIDELLACARSCLQRLGPAEARRAMQSGATLVDIRADSQITRDGTIAGALVIPRNVLEWRLDPASEHRHPAAPQLGDHVIVLCDDGYQSSLAAASLQQLGFTRATDVDGGYQAWRAAALPIDSPPTQRHRPLSGSSRTKSGVSAHRRRSRAPGHPRSHTENPAIQRD